MKITKRCKILSGINSQEIFEATIDSNLTYSNLEPYIALGMIYFKFVASIVLHTLFEAQSIKTLAIDSNLTSFDLQLYNIVLGMKYESAIFNNLAENF